MTSTAGERTDDPARQQSSGRLPTRDDGFYPPATAQLPRTTGPGQPWAPVRHGTDCWLIGSHYRGGIDSLGVEREWWIVAFDADTCHAYGYLADGRNAGWSAIDLSALAAERDHAGHPRVTRDEKWLSVSRRRWAIPVDSASAG